MGESLLDVLGGIILKDNPVFTKTPPDTFLASNKTDVVGAGPTGYLVRKRDLV